MSKLSVFSIYVSYFSEKFIKKFSEQHIDELGSNVSLVNSSTNEIAQEVFPDFNVVNVGENIGFAAANNIGIASGDKYKPDYFLIINPDVLLPSSWLNNVLKAIDACQYSDVGIFTVPLLGYDFAQERATEKIDGLGIEHTWYGRWYDVSQGDDVDVLEKDLLPYEVQAACGALMLIHKDVIRDLLIKDGYVFNEAYFMYKEDIELSLRIRNMGKKIIMIPSASVFHCRGWENIREKAPYWARERSARNELKMHMKFCWRFLPYSFLKYIYVRLIERLVLKSPVRAN